MLALWLGCSSPGYSPISLPHNFQASLISHSLWWHIIANPTHTPNLYPPIQLNFLSSLVFNSIPPPTIYLTYLSYCLSLPGECLFSKGRDFSLLCSLVYAWYLEGSLMQKRNLVSFSEQMAGREGRRRTALCQLWGLWAVVSTMEGLSPVAPVRETPRQPRAAGVRFHSAVDPLKGCFLHVPRSELKGHVHHSQQDHSLRRIMY